MTSGKAAQYKLFWIGKSFKDSIFLTKKWINKLIDKSTVIDRMIVIKLFKGLLFQLPQFMCVLGWFR